MPVLLHDPTLRLFSETLDAAEKQKNATANRLRSIIAAEPELEANPVIEVIKIALKRQVEVETLLVTQMKKHIKQTPFAGWIKAERGVGAKQAARLLAAIGDPYWMDRYQMNPKVAGSPLTFTLVESRPRTVSELWSFAGYSVNGGAARSLRKREVANWSPKAKMRAFLVAQSCMKQKDSGSRYRAVYDLGRAQYFDAVHMVECERCAPRGKPAAIGTPLNPGHQMARALRLVSKEILRDLWLIARDYHAEYSNVPPISSEV